MSVGGRRSVSFFFFFPRASSHKKKPPIIFAINVLPATMTVSPAVLHGDQPWVASTCYGSVGQTWACHLTITGTTKISFTTSNQVQVNLVTSTIFLKFLNTMYPNTTEYTIF
jgi:hypothetical protein